MQILEGFMPYLGYETYYRVVGEKSTKKAPLILIHGGPGSTHNYFELLDELANEGRQIIMYDQLGCGRSSMPDRPDLWHAKTWIEELMALKKHLGIEDCHLLGQSWGGMLVIAYLCDYQPKNVKSAVFSSTLSSAKLWAEEQARLIRFLPEVHQEAIAKAEQTQNFKSTDYLEANAYFMQKYAGDRPTEASPEPLRRPKNSGVQAYQTAWGPNEYMPTGTLKDFNYTEKLATIEIPVLVTSGTEDLSTPFVSKTMVDHLSNVRWELFRQSRHMPYVDENQRYIKVLNQWLNQQD